MHYGFRHKSYVCGLRQDALIWVFRNLCKWVQNKALTLSTVRIIQRIIAPSNCLQTSITIGALDYSHTHKHTHCPDGRQMFNRQGQGVHAVIVCSTISQYSQQCSDRHIHINPGNFLWNGNHVLFLKACLCLFYLFLVAPFTLSVSVSLSLTLTLALAHTLIQSTFGGYVHQGRDHRLMTHAGISALVYENYNTPPKKTHV